MIINYLDMYAYTVEGKSPVNVCAPTETAARNIGGVTIHSLLKIRVSKYLNFEPLTSFQIEQLRRNFIGIP